MSKLPSQEEKATYVENMFNNIATKYDFLNTLMSFGLDKSWRRFAVERSRAKKGDKCLDICCGTGMITRELADVVGPTGSVTGLDFSANMLAIAEENMATCPNKDVVKFIRGNAMELPFPDNSFDCVTVGWGLRNVPHIGKTVQEMTRVVKPGGKVISLDMAKPTAPIFKQGYWLYFEKIVPLMGRLWARKQSAYNYLHQSAVEFPPQWELAQIFAAEGLVKTKYHNLLGGVVAVVEGEK